METKLHPLRKFHIEMMFLKSWVGRVSSDFEKSEKDRFVCFANQMIPSVFWSGYYNRYLLHRSFIKQDRKDVILYFYEEGYTKNQISKLLGFSPNTVYKYVNMPADNYLVDESDKEAEALAQQWQRKRYLFVPQIYNTFN